MSNSKEGGGSSSNFPGSEKGKKSSSGSSIWKIIYYGYGEEDGVAAAGRERRVAVDATLLAERGRKRVIV